MADATTTLASDVADTMAIDTFCTFIIYLLYTWLNLRADYLAFISTLALMFAIESQIYMCVEARQTRSVKSADCRFLVTGIWFVAVICGLAVAIAGPPREVGLAIIGACCLLSLISKIMFYFPDDGPCGSATCPRDAQRQAPAATTTIRNNPNSVFDEVLRQSAPTRTRHRQVDWPLRRPPPSYETCGPDLEAGKAASDAA